MSEDISRIEQENQPSSSIRVINLEQEFPLISPEFYEQASSFILAIDEKTGVMMGTSLFKSFDTSQKLYVITPFHPENGYQIGSRDFNIESRRQKFAELGDLGEIDQSLDSISLQIGVRTPGGPFLRRIGEKYKIDKSLSFSLVEFQFDLKAKLEKLRPDLKSKLDRLRVILSFPGTPEVPIFDPRYIAPISLTSHLAQKDGYYSRFFYPTDTGPLAVNKDGPQYSDDWELYEPGLRLVVPDDSKITSHIKAKFILDQEGIPQNTR